MCKVFFPNFLCSIVNQHLKKNWQASKKNYPNNRKLTKTKVPPIQKTSIKMWLIYSQLFFLEKLANFFKKIENLQ
jgi:hypothetical protein